MPISKKKKLILCEWMKFRCEDCLANGNEKEYSFYELEVHKINKELGYKNWRNLKLVCKKHHDFYSSAQRKANGIQ